MSLTSVSEEGARFVNLLRLMSTTSAWEMPRFFVEVRTPLKLAQCIESVETRPSLSPSNFLTMGCVMQKIESEKAPLTLKP